MIIYLVILLLLFVDFWNIKPFGFLSTDMQLLILVGYLFYGCFKFRKRFKLKVKDRYQYLKWIMIGIFLSMLPAYLFYEQSFIQSLITYRTQFLLPCTVITLFVISPKLEEIIKSIYIFSIFLFGANILKQIDYSLFVLKESTLDRIQLRGDLSALHVVTGVGYVTFPLFYYLQKLKENFFMNDFIKVIFCFIVIYMTENRSTLFPVAIFLVYTFLLIHSKYKPFILVGCFFMIGVFVAQNTDTIIGLVDETSSQLLNEDYNRNKAWMFYLFMFNPHWICDILGNGFLSAKTTNIMQSLMENGIYNSDVGFIGYWNQFGIIPIIAIFIMYIKTLKGNGYPYFMKLIVLFSLICGITIKYYGVKYTIIDLALFYYLFYYFLNSQQNR